MDEENDLAELREIFERSPDDSLAMAEVMLGEDAIAFSKSDIGRYLIGRCNIELGEALEALKKTYPWRRRRIQQLQNEIWRCEHFKMWLMQAIVAGKTALSELDRRTTTGEL